MQGAIQIKDNDNEMMAVPVWLFWTTRDMERSQEMSYNAPTLNAIDGSVIDRNQGY